MTRGIPLLIGAFFYFNAEEIEINSNDGFTEKWNSSETPAQKKHIQFTDRITSKNQTSYIQNNTLSTPPRPAILRGAHLRWRGSRPV